MFDGKMLRGDTGTPMRRIERAKSSFAEAEPDPFTFENFTTKSLTASSFLVSFIVILRQLFVAGCGMQAPRALLRADAYAYAMRRSDSVPRRGGSEGRRLPLAPRGAGSAESAMRRDSDQYAGKA